MKRFILLTSLLVWLLCAVTIALMGWVGHHFDLSPPILIYAKVGDGIRAYDERLDTSILLFPMLNPLNVDFYWSSDRRAVVSVHLESQGATDENAFVFTLYPVWHADPVDVAAFDRYTTPHWSPDGESLIVQGCVFQTDAACTRTYFYRIRRDEPMLETLDFPELSGLVREWQWLDDHRLILWRDRELLTLDLVRGESEVAFNGVPPQPREIHWADDMSRVSYLVSSGNDLCLRVLVIAEGEQQEVGCGELNASNPIGWMDDGHTLFYVRGDEDEIRLYDSVLRVDRSATNPPTFLDWSFDGLFSLPHTPYLVHHATFGRQVLEVINIETAQLEPIVFTMQGFSDVEFVPAPDGRQIAMRLREQGTLGLVRFEEVVPIWVDSIACCSVEWD